jgi:hypothetical protein
LGEIPPQTESKNDVSKGKEEKNYLAKKELPKSKTIGFKIDANLS